MNSDIEIARDAKLRPIAEIGAALGIPDGALIPYGHTKAKLEYGFLESLADRPDGKLILVTGMTPTPAGEGKTTTSVGLCDGLHRIGASAVTCLREPSLGPCFGMKGGAAGGGNLPGQKVQFLALCVGCPDNVDAAQGRPPLHSRGACHTNETLVS